MIKTIKNKYKKFVINLRIYSLNITLMATLLLVLVFLGATTFLYMRSPATIAYRQDLEESFRQENAKGEWKRLHKYHGYPQVVVYEEGKTPYFYDKQGIKCAFVYPPPKAAGIIIHQTQAEDSEYFEPLTLNDKTLVVHD